MTISTRIITVAAIRNLIVCCNVVVARAHVKRCTAPHQAQVIIGVNEAVAVI